MHITAAEAVANGAAWLDERYPGWVDVINLDTLELSDCTMCVLGQVWTGCYTAEEKEQILPQIIRKLDAVHASKFYLSPGVMAGQGFQVLLVKDLDIVDDWKVGDVARYGFSESDCIRHCPDDCPNEATYEDLADEWTRVIISRRLAAHPDVVTEFSNLDSIEHELVVA